MHTILNRTPTIGHITRSAALAGLCAFLLPMSATHASDIPKPLSTLEHAADDIAPEAKNPIPPLLGADNILMPTPQAGASEDTSKDAPEGADRQEESTEETEETLAPPAAPLDMGTLPSSPAQPLPSNATAEAAPSNTDTPDADAQTAVTNDNDDNQNIEVTRTIAPDPSISTTPANAPTSAETGLTTDTRFSRNLWEGLTGSQLLWATESLPLHTESPALRTLMIGLFSAAARLPDDMDTRQHANWQKRRYQALLTLQAHDALRALLNATPKPQRDALWYDTAFELALHTNDDQHACSLVPEALALNNTADHWQHRQLYCHALTGDEAALSLTTELMREQNRTIPQWLHPLLAHTMQQNTHSTTDAAPRSLAQHWEQSEPTRAQYAMRASAKEDHSGAALLMLLELYANGTPDVQELKQATLTLESLGFTDEAYALLKEQLAHASSRSAR